METVSSADGSAIAYESSGRGPALVIVNGAFGDRTSGAELAAALDNDFTVYRYDRRGRGDSDNNDVYTTLNEAEDLAAVADEAGGQPFVFGHSSGAALALEAAAAGMGMRGLVVHEPPYIRGPATSSETADRFAQEAADGHQAEVAEQFLRNTGASDEEVAQVKDSPAWPHMTLLAPTLANDIRVLNEGVVPTDRLSRVTSPVLATAGGLSAPWALAAVKAVAAAVADGEWRIIDGVGHGVPPEIMAGVLRDFFVAE
jgi:pimeloyl-ACP methyl ester carboxylesterase